MQLTLKRLRFEDDNLGTFGSLLLGGERLCVTVELPWHNNEPHISCIPFGNYQCEKYLSPRHGYYVWLIKEVPNRQGIEFHIANFARELLGCVGVGSQFGKIDGIPCVLNSKNTFEMLRSTLPDHFSLTII